MRVLMFGWEFPPYKSGGLGTACYGMGRALAKKGTEILFVLPQTPLDAPVRVGERLSLCSASGTRVERTARNLRINEEVRELWREKLHIDTWTRCCSLTTRRKAMTSGGVSWNASSR